MKPLQQVFAIVLEDIPEYKTRSISFKTKINRLRRKFKDDRERMKKKEDDMRNKVVKELIFDSYIRTSENLKAGNRDITDYFTYS